MGNKIVFSFKGISAQHWQLLSQTIGLSFFPNPIHVGGTNTQYGSPFGSRRSGSWWHEGATMKKNIWVTGQLPTLSITINGPAHTSPSINALAGSEVM